MTDHVPASYGSPAKAPGLAIASLVTGLAGLVLVPCLWFFPVLPILGIVFGHVSLTRINREGLPGRGMAITGLVTGYVGLGIGLLLIVLVILGTITSPTPTF